MGIYKGIGDVMVNKQLLVGNLGKDPETNEAESMVKFSVATSRSWKNKDSGEWEEDTQWHNCVGFSWNVKKCMERLHKGSKVYIMGRTEHREYEKDGEKKYFTQVVIEDIKFLDPKESGSDLTSATKDVFGEEEIPF